MHVRALFGLRLRGFVFIAFLSPPYRETPKRPKTQQQNIEKGKNFDARPRKTFFITFLSSPHREVLNQRNNKKVERKKVKKSPQKIFSRRNVWKLIVSRTPLVEKRPKTHLNTTY
jgi:hypothetical protein